jgi:beta-lactamase superfamily II metal-dependent hydrolase
MFNLKKGYVLSGIVTGCILLFTFFSQLPDGKLHVIICDVGQGDAAYIKFPGGEDMLIDGGPGGKTPKVLGCLGKYMPLFDRTIDIVVLTHPQEDHLGGLEEVVKRYEVKNFVHSDVGNTTQGFETLMSTVKEKRIMERIVGTGEKISIGAATVSVVWPESSFLAEKKAANVLGVSNVNDASVVLKLSYGTFDAVFPGDADSHVDGNLTKIPLSDPDEIEVLKVPHHGSKTGMTEGFYEWLGPIKLAVISVGKNMYGHPAAETITRLEKDGAQVLRTDKEGNIEVVSDGKSWSVK